MFSLLHILISNSSIACSTEGLSPTGTVIFLHMEIAFSRLTMATPKKPADKNNKRHQKTCN